MNTKKNKNIYAKIHILVSECKLTDEQYRDILRDHFSVVSSKELNNFDKNRLIKILSKIKTMVSLQGVDCHCNSSQNGQIEQLTFYQRKKLTSLLNSNEQIKYPLQWCSKIIKRHIDNIYSITKSEASKLISILLKMKE